MLTDSHQPQSNWLTDGSVRIVKSTTQFCSPHFFTELSCRIENFLTLNGSVPCTTSGICELTERISGGHVRHFRGTDLQSPISTVIPNNEYPMTIIRNSDDFIKHRQHMDRTQYKCESQSDETLITDSETSHSYTDS